MSIIQVTVFICGMASALLFSCKRDLRKWAYLVSAIAQPFWMYITYEAGQWGMFWLSVFYTFMTARGLINTWSGLLKGRGK